MIPPPDPARARNSIDDPLPLAFATAYAMASYLEGAAMAVRHGDYGRQPAHSDAGFRLREQRPRLLDLTAGNLQRNLTFRAGDSTEPSFPSMLDFLSTIPARLSSMCMSPTSSSLQIVASLARSDRDSHTSIVPHRRPKSCIARRALTHMKK